MNVSLSPEHERLVHQRVETGRYASAADVVAEALRLMTERDKVWDLQDSAVREKIAAGVASLRAGRSVDGEAFMAGMDAELAALETKGR